MQNKGSIYIILLYSTILSIFSENIYYRTPLNDIDIRFYYLIYFVNFFLFLFVVKRLGFNKTHLYILLALILSGVIGLCRAPDITSRFVLSIFGITLCSVYYYVFIKNIGVSYEALFKLYLKVTFLISIHAIIKLIYYLGVHHHFPNEYGVFTEPAHYCVVILPACFYYLKKSIIDKTVYFKGIFIILSVLVSGSSLGALGFLAMFPFIFKKIKLKYLILSFILMAGIATTLYYKFDKFNDRAKAATAIFQNGVEEKGSPNQSSFSWVSNFLVALKSCKESYGLGHGLGSHYTYYYKYIDGILPGVQLLGDQYYGMNAKDGSGLFNRTLSDLGLWGLLLIFLFIKRFFIRGNTELAIINNAILIAFITRLIRDGMYFTPDLYFFVWGYYFTCIEYKKRLLNESEEKSYY